MENSNEQINEKLLPKLNSSNPHEQIFAFNGLRGIFIIMVLICHLPFIGNNLLTQAVDGFLLMSGWLNALSMDNTYDKGPTKLTAVKNFFIHRFFRIAPVYYLCILCVMNVMGPHHRQLCWDYLLYNIFFV